MLSLWLNVWRKGGIWWVGMNKWDKSLFNKRKQKQLVPQSTTTLYENPPRTSQRNSHNPSSSTNHFNSSEASPVSTEKSSKRSKSKVFEKR
jgi:hypothetical protein